MASGLQEKNLLDVFHIGFSQRPVNVEVLLKIFNAPVSQSKTKRPHSTIQDPLQGP